MRQLTIAFFLVVCVGLCLPAMAQEQPKPPDTAEQCTNLLNAVGDLQISARQARLVADIQAGVAAVCRQLIVKEKQTPVVGETKATPPEEEVKK